MDGDQTGERFEFAKQMVLILSSAEKLLDETNNPEAVLSLLRSLRGFHTGYNETH